MNVQKTGSSTVDVLIVGAGPVGSFLAIELLRHGLKPRIVDKAPTRSTHSKALAVQMRTIEAFEDVGIHQAFLDTGNRVFGLNVYSDTVKLTHVDLGNAESPFPHILVVPQFDTERLLEEELLRRGVSVERDVEAVALEQNEHGVSVTLRATDGTTERVDARWVVGCDGAHSFVRRAVGIHYEGEDLGRTFCFVDVDTDLPIATDEAHAFLTADGVMLAFKLPHSHTWRIVATVPDGDADALLEDFEHETRKRTGLDFEFGTRHWDARFPIRHRKASRYREGRVFLAGDAAHCHSPLGGQGMNTGLQDAYNLAWKLSLVEHGHAVPSLLESYGLEREPVAESVLTETGLATRATTLRNPVGRAIRNQVARIVTSFDAVQERIASTLGEIAFGYRDSPIVAEERGSVLNADWVGSSDSETPDLWAWRKFGGGPRPGERAPDSYLDENRRLFTVLRGIHHTVLLFDGAAETEEGYTRFAFINEALQGRFGSRLRCVVVTPGDRAPQLPATVEVERDVDQAAHKRYGASAECVYVIRPDGYVGYRAQPVTIEGLIRFFDRILVAHT